LDRSRGLENATAYETDTNKTLSLLRDTTGKETIQREIGGLGSIPASSLLQSEMLRSASSSGSTQSSSFTEAGSSLQREDLPDLQYNNGFTNSPSRQQSSQQQPIEPYNLVRILSHEMALGEWEASVETTVTMQVLRSAISQIRNVPKASSTLQEIWQSLSNQEMHWVAMVACGRVPWPAGPGQIQHQWEPSRVVTEKVPHRSARLKALGNSVVPQISEYVGRLILEHDKMLSFSRLKGK
jgi:hypothetical protein